MVKALMEKQDEKPSDFDFDIETPGKCPVCKGGGDEVCTEQHFDGQGVIK